MAMSPLPMNTALEKVVPSQLPSNPLCTHGPSVCRLAVRRADLMLCFHADVGMLHSAFAGGLCQDAVRCQLKIAC